MNHMKLWREYKKWKSRLRHLTMQSCTDCRRFFAFEACCFDVLLIAVPWFPSLLTLCCPQISLLSRMPSGDNDFFRCSSIPLWPEVDKHLLCLQPPRSYIQMAQIWKIKPCGCKNWRRGNTSGVASMTSLWRFAELSGRKGLTTDLRASIPIEIVSPVIPTWTCLPINC